MTPFKVKKASIYVLKLSNILMMFVILLFLNRKRNMKNFFIPLKSHSKRPLKALGFFKLWLLFQRFCDLVFSLVTHDKILFDFFDNLDKYLCKLFFQVLLVDQQKP